ncbi:hypothetical protein ACX27_13010 [Nostoc piscinale CENA21]|uniref:Uncharacterized protein n=1 Tax=Nostoc piscinale CENA21 TaxID=224013 RepID=A0A0M4SL21_9NOSO|nr:hypothetical protein ACX27_13010 [Nostoc piscinale CENA21]
MRIKIFLLLSIFPQILQISCIVRYLFFSPFKLDVVRINADCGDWKKKQGAEGRVQGREEPMTKDK